MTTRTDQPTSGQPRPALPGSFATSVAAVHAVSEHVLSAARHAASGRVGLIPTSGGVATPPFGQNDRVVSIEGAELIDRDASGERRAPITTLADAAAFVGVNAGVPGGLWSPVTNVEPDAPLVVDPEAIGRLADWYSFVGQALDGLHAAGAALDPYTLWPEGFDLATTGSQINFGGSAGDRFIARPYLYVGPFDRSVILSGPSSYWNAAFGAALAYDAIGSLDLAVDFLVRGWQLATG